LASTVGAALRGRPCVKAKPRAATEAAPTVDASLFIDFQNGEEGFLRDLDAANFLHPLLAFFLLLEQLAFARDVAAVTLRNHVLAERLHRLTRDHFVPYRGLNRHLERLSRN